MTTDGAMSPASSVARLRELLDALPPDLARNVFTHASWTPKRADSYERLAFLGDSVLSLAITSHIFPRLEAERFGAGELTKIRAQTVSGRSCRAVAERLGVPERLAAAAPAGAAATVPNLVSTERVLASITEAVIGACYLTFGYEPVAEAVVEAFQSGARRTRSSTRSTSNPRCRSGWPGAARWSATRSSARAGPPHDRTFTIAARIGEEEIGRGVGRSKKDAEQAAAQEALAHVALRAEPAGSRGVTAMYLKSITMKGFKSFPDRTRLEFGPGHERDRRAQRLGQVERHRRGAVGARRAVADGRARPLDAGRDLRRRARAARRRAARRSSWCSTTPRACSGSAPRSRSCGGSTATARASTASAAPSAG